MTNQNPIPSGWNCSKCGEINAQEMRFCRKCGGENPITSQISSEQLSTTVSNGASKGSVGKIVLIIFLLLLLLGGAAVGGYFWYKSNLNKIAKEYLTAEKINFEGVIASINNLSTEKKIEKGNEQMEIFLKKVEEEKDKAEKALADTRAAKDRNEKAKTNKLVASIDSLFKKFYTDSVDRLTVYGKYTNYEYQVTKVTKDFEDNLKKLLVKNKNDVIPFLKDYLKIMEDYKNQINSITPPEGLEEAQKKGVDLLDEELNLFKDLVSAVEANDFAKYKKIEADIDEFKEESNNKYMEIYQLEKYYFEKLNEKFKDLHTTAGNVDSQLISIGTTLNLYNLHVDIQSW